MSQLTRIAIVGDYRPDFPPHQATQAAVEYSAAALGRNIQAEWIATDAIDTPAGGRRLQESHGLWIAPGSPYRSLAGALAAIRFAREQSRPLLGTCAGFQHVIVEFARNVLGFADAQHAEYDPNASRLFIAKLDCSLVGRSLPITLRAGSRTAQAYGQLNFTEQYYCQFGVNPEFARVLSSGSLRTVGSDPEGEIRVVELADHPFFIATLFLPQLRTTREAPHPLVTAFLRACAG